MSCAVTVAIAVLAIAAQLAFFSSETNMYPPPASEAPASMLSLFRSLWNDAVHPYQLPSDDSELIEELKRKLHSSKVSEATLHSMWITPILHLNVRNLEIEDLDLVRFNANLFTAISHEFEHFKNVK